MEHRIARLGQLGAKQARYIGRAKTLFQLVTAATVANLTLIAARTQAVTDGLSALEGFVCTAVHRIAVYLGMWAGLGRFLGIVAIGGPMELEPVIPSYRPLLPVLVAQNRAFRPRF